MSLRDLIPRRNYESILIFMTLLMFSVQANASSTEPTPTPTPAPIPGDLKTVMQAIGAGFKASFTAARNSDNSPEAQQTVLELKESIALALNVLPSGINPSDTEAVERYQGMISGLLNLAQTLVDEFATVPFDQAKALEILGKMNEARKKGHAIFRG